MGSVKSPWPFPNFFFKLFSRWGQLHGICGSGILIFFLHLSQSIASSSFSFLSFRSFDKQSHHLIFVRPRLLFHGLSQHNSLKISLKKTIAVHPAMESRCYVYSYLLCDVDGVCMYVLLLFSLFKFMLYAFLAA